MLDENALNKDNASAFCSVDAGRAAVDIAYCAHRTPRFRSRCPDIVGRSKSRNLSRRKNHRNGSHRLSGLVGCVDADQLRAFSACVAILRSMRSGKPIIPCHGRMRETEALAECTASNACSPEGTTFMEYIDSLALAVKKQATDRGRG